MSKEEEKKRIESEPDYIYCASVGNSLDRFMMKYLDGVNDDKAAQVLLTTPEKVKEYYAQAIDMIRKDMGVEIEEEDS